MDPPLGGSRFISMIEAPNWDGVASELPPLELASGALKAKGNNERDGWRRGSCSFVAVVVCGGNGSGGGGAVRKFATAIGVSSARRKPVPPPLTGAFFRGFTKLVPPLLTVTAPLLPSPASEWPSAEEEKSFSFAKLFYID